MLCCQWAARRAVFGWRPNRSNVAITVTSCVCVACRDSAYADHSKVDFNEHQPSELVAVGSHEPLACFLDRSGGARMLKRLLALPAQAVCTPSGLLVHGIV